MSGSQFRAPFPVYTTSKRRPSKASTAWYTSAHTNSDRSARRTSAASRLAASMAGAEKSSPVTRTVGCRRARSRVSSPKWHCRWTRRIPSSGPSSSTSNGLMVGRPALKPRRRRSRRRRGWAPARPTSPGWSPPSSSTARRVGAVDLPVMPPVSPMLAKLTRELPIGDYLYEPKWDGFRCIVFRDGDEVELGSRNERPLTRYFPEVVDAVRAVAAAPMRRGRRGGGRRRRRARLRRPVAADPPGRLAGADAGRCRPRPRFVAFDLLALGADDLRTAGFGRAAGPAGRGPGRRRPAGAPHAGHRRPRRGRRVVLPLRGRRARRGGGQGGRPALPGGPAGHVEGQARAHRRLRGRRVPRGTRAARASARSCSGCTTTTAGCTTSG